MDFPLSVCGPSWVYLPCLRTYITVDFVPGRREIVVADVCGSSMRTMDSSCKDGKERGTTKTRDQTRPLDSNCCLLLRKLGTLGNFCINLRRPLLLSVTLSMYFMSMELFPYTKALKVKYTSFPPSRAAKQLKMPQERHHIPLEPANL